MRIPRRKFIGLVGGAAVWPRAARAQQGDRVRRIGVLMNLSESDPSGSKVIGQFRQGLQQSGWAEGRNLLIDIRWGAGDRDLYRRYASELVAGTPEAVLAATTDVVVSVQQASPAVPIVFVSVIDPLGLRA
jgi:putative ABC transport system substrate-binding protein